MKVYKAIIIGFGHHSRNRLFQAITELPYIQEIYLFDILSKVFEDIEQQIICPNSKIKIKYSVSWEKAVSFLDENTLAVISTSAESHYKYFLELSNFGVKFIYVEKPMCQSLAQAIDMKEIAEKKNIKVAVGFYNQYMEVTQNIYNYIEKYNLGDLVKISSVGGNNDISALGIHMIDLANYLFKSIPVKIFGHISGRTVNPRGSQYFNHGGIAKFIYPQERELLLSYHHLSNVSCTIEFLFKYGIIKYNLNVGYIEIYSVDDKEPTRPLYRHQVARFLEKIVTPNNFINYFCKIFDSLVNGDDYPDMSRSMDSMQALLGVFVSNDLGTFIDLPIGNDNGFFKKKYPIT